MGDTPPYIAVITLAVMTAHHWRTCRTKLALAGIIDPMAMPSMHVLLDVIEQMVLESMTGSGTPDEDRVKRERFIDQLYKPDAPVKGEKPPPPSWFVAEDVESGFDRFARAAR